MSLGEEARGSPAFRVIRAAQRHDKEASHRFSQTRITKLFASQLAMTTKRKERNRSVRSGPEDRRRRRGGEERAIGKFPARTGSGLETPDGSQGHCPSPPADWSISFDFKFRKQQRSSHGSRQRALTACAEGFYDKLKAGVFFSYRFCFDWDRGREEYIERRRKRMKKRSQSCVTFSDEQYSETLRS